MTYGYGPSMGGGWQRCGWAMCPPMPAGAGYGAWATPGGWGLGGLRTWGGTYSPQYVATGMPTDEEVTEMVYDALDEDPLVPYDAPIDVTVDAGRVTLTGTVPNKRAKHSAGDDAWWIPGVVDVINNIQISGRRRARGAPREAEAPEQPAQAG